MPGPQIPYLPLLSYSFKLQPLWRATDPRFLTCLSKCGSCTSRKYGSCNLRINANCISSTTPFVHDAEDSTKRGVQIGNPLAQTPGKVVQQSRCEATADLAKTDPTATDLAKRGVQLGNPLAQTPGQAVQQGYRETAVDLATVDFAATDCAASRDLVGDG